ncbi:hypothetical protein T484DRAFT_1785200 [Baffinella frigidus]|nr:hypothetical protein T484DRAFT_1785200 [Cryptophyta sp. CCMP2293]
MTPPSLKPELRFIVILREPLSWFNHLVGQRPVPGNDTKTSGRDFEQEPPHPGNDTKTSARDFEQERPHPGNDTKTSARDFEQEVQLSLERRGENWGGLESGRYARQLEEWLAFFDRRQGRHERSGDKTYDPTVGNP